MLGNSPLLACALLLASACAAKAAAPANGAGPASAAAAPEVFPLAPATARELDERVARLGPSAGLSDRLLSASASFLGTAYGHSPLGEGQGVDPDPLLRFDQVDCVTFVEEALALGYGRSGAEAFRVLQDLRYGPEQISFAARNHLTELQWIPQNIAKGYLVDVTRELGGDAAVETSKTLTPEDWRHREIAQDLDLPESSLPFGTVRFPMIPLGRVSAIAARIPSGTLLFVVRRDKKLYPTRISHLGIVIQKEGHPYLRHAALAEKKVVDEELASFVSRHGSFKSWPVDGVQLLRLRPDGERVKALKPFALLRSSGRLQ